MSAFARIITPFLCAFLFGVFLAGVTDASVLLAGGVLLGAPLLLVFAARYTRAAMLAVCMIGCAFGIFRFVLWRDAPEDMHLVHAMGNTVELTGVVADEPDVREKGTSLVVALRTLNEGGTEVPVSGNLRVMAARYPQYQYGDVLLLYGKLERPKAFAEADGRVFDYPNYLASKGIRAQMSFAHIARLREGEGSSVIAVLFRIKARFQHSLALALPEPHGALMGGLLLGGKQSLGTEWIEKFRTAGIVHIIVLSGYNMTVVATWLVVVFRFLGFVGSLAVGAVGIVLFALMTGGGATVLRAALMALLALFARATGRTSDIARALLLAAALMVLQNPSILLFDPSFQLSFLASLGLIVVAPVVEKKVTLWKNSPTLREVLVSTLATQIIVLPILLYQTGILSLVALPANLLVLPLIPLTMLLGFVAGIIALIVPPIALIAGLPAYTLLSWMFVVADTAARIPFAALHLPAFSPWCVFVSYAFLAWWLRREHRTLRAHPISHRKIYREI